MHSHTRGFSRVAVIIGVAVVAVLFGILWLLLGNQEPTAPAPASTAPTLAVREIKPAAPVTPPADTPAPTPAAPQNELTNALLGAATYRPTSGNPLTLQNGRAIVKQTGYNTAVTYQLQSERTVFADDRQYAAAILTSNDGGSGTFYEMYVMKYEAGQAVQVAYLFLGDRVRLDSLYVTSTTATITYATWMSGTYDPPVTRTVTYSR